MEVLVDRTLKLQNVSSLRADHLSRGGFFVVYLACSSLFMVTVTTPTLVWVGPDQSRRWTGFKHSFSSLLLGWWSFGGLLHTPLVLTHNLLGGFDMTRIIVDARTCNGDSKWESADAGRRFQQHRFEVFILVLVGGSLLVVPIVLFLLVNGLPWQAR